MSWSTPTPLNGSIRSVLPVIFAEEALMIVLGHQIVSFAILTHIFDWTVASDMAVQRKTINTNAVNVFSDRNATVKGDGTFTSFDCKIA